MAYSSDKGGARPVSATDFNDRVKQLLADKPAIQAVPKDRTAKRNFTRSTPRG
ncbi:MULTISPECIES: hypothetical protein [Methylorubrum]|uniref:hypothetical protein n=1 Tax=Methylorubrum TaxID=2282523 RepID=UPI0020A075D5|nr:MULTISPECIES: hypothetical protein [Methylorubrum]MCP1554399.1 hypothetical protein [Methylorubrum extorquens]MCP1579290.1 hypothetical protein [Methylorubrum extorquens]